MKANIVTVRYTEFCKAWRSTVWHFYIKIMIQDQSGFLTELEIGNKGCQYTCKPGAFSVGLL